MQVMSTDFIYIAANCRATHEKDHVGDDKEDPKDLRTLAKFGRHSCR